MGRHLRGEIAAALVGGSDVPADKVDQRVVDYTGVYELDGRDDEALLIALRRQRHRAGRDPADVGMVRPRGHVAEMNLFVRAVNENWRYRGYVGQVRSAKVRVVEYHQIAGQDSARLEDIHCGADRQRHGAQVDRDVGRLGDHVALDVEYRAREVAAFLDVRRKGCPLHRGAHLFGDGREHVTEHLQRERQG